MRPAWLADIRRASLRCLSSSTFLAWVRSFRARGLSGLQLLQAASADLFTSIPYRFDGQRHVVADLDGCRSRGWGACADAVAILAAVAHAERLSTSAAVLVEAPASLPSYAHVRLLVRVGDGAGLVLDPYGSQAARRRPSADYIVGVGELLASSRPALARPLRPLTVAEVSA